MTFPLREMMCLHASASDLQFLNPVKNRLGRLLGHRLETYALGNQHSCAEARMALKRATGKLVLVLAHGGSSYIRSGEYLNRLTGEVMPAENFLEKEDLDVFADKAVFCLSCDSNCLAEASLSAGAAAFVGFDEIPFNKFDDHGNPTGNHAFVKHAQQLLAAAVLAALERFVGGRASLDEAVGFMRLWICREAVRFVREEKAVVSRHDIAALFLRVKDGIRHHGTTGVRFAQ